MIDIKNRKITQGKNGEAAVDHTKENKSNKENDSRQGSPKKGLPLKILSRVVVIFSLLVVVYFSTKEETFKTLAKQNEILSGKGQVIECSTDYMREINKFEGCFPKECKRFVTDKVVSVREAEELLALAKKGFALGGSLGGASILDLHTGALSMEQQFINIYKREEAKTLFTQNDFNTYKVVKDKIKSSVARHFGVNSQKIYLTYPTFFSELTSEEAVTIHDEYWHPHVDKETYKTFHYTTLLYLNDYNIDFRGGRFVFVDQKLNRTVEPRKARVVMFTSGKENMHYVEQVRSGVRYAVTISFTCDIKFAIDDPHVNKYK